MDTRQLHKALLSKEIGNFPLVNYEPAALHEWESGWIIEYRVLNPETGTLERKRLKFQKIRKRMNSDSQARKYAKTFCNTINEKLESGWNPYNEGKKAKAFHKLTDAFKAFLSEKELDYKNGVFSHDSMRTYKSQIEMIVAWISANNRDISVARFDKDMARQYLDYVYVEKKVSPRTWNNYLRFMRTVWTWMIEKNYCTENVFQPIKTKAEKEKKRVIIPEEWNKKIIEYFREHNPMMELVCGLVYNSFMRPAEICRTQLSDIQISNNAIYLPGAKTKNKRSRWCLLPPHLINMLIDLRLDKYPLNSYLFSSGLEIGKTPLCTRKIDKYWDKMRTAIGLPKEMKLYSYRDTGITDLKKAGHSNLFISSITGHLNSNEIETYTHAPDPKSLAYIMNNSKRL